MSATGKIVKYHLKDVVRSRWLIGYTGFFLLATELLLRFGGDPTKALVSLVNVVLLMIPLISLVFGTIYIHDAREFTELLLAQPVGRRALFAGLYLGLALSLSFGFAVGVGIPFLMRAGAGSAGTLLVLLATGIALTFVFTGLAFIIAIRWDDRVKAIGVAVVTWLAAGIAYDAIVLVLATTLANYPLERPLLALMLANPIDLSRVVLLLRLDISALMGYTGAVFKQFFGSGRGMLIAAAALLAWIGAPALFGSRTFRRKDF
jgi:Cu-processing system permease protein